MPQETDLDMDEVFKDVDVSSLPSDERLARLSKLAMSQINIQAEVDDLEKKLVEAKERLAKVSEHEIPELFDEMGIDEFRMRNGVRVKIEPFFTGKITGPEAYEWLDTHGHGDIIRGEISVPYPRGFDQEKLRAVVQAAKELGLEPDNIEGVHHSTLRAWIKEMITKGREFPREMFNVYVGRRTKMSVR